MKNQILTLLFLLGILSACGKGTGELTPPNGVHFETRELTSHELAQFETIEFREHGESRELGESNAKLAPTLEAFAGLADPLVNGLAGVVQKLIGSDGPAFGAVVLGHATPRDTDPFQLEKGSEDSKGFEKKLVSLFGTELVKATYKISYQYKMKHKRVGSYLANVKFTPLMVNSDPLWKLSAEAVSEKPTNVGTAKNPVAELGFSVTFTAKGIGTRATTDEFKLEAKTGNLTATIRDFE